MKQKHWYHYLWLWSILYFSLGFVNILFAWLGLISFCLPLLFAIVGGNYFIMNFLEAITPEIKKHIDKSNAEAEKKMGKHLNKYIKR